MKTRWIFAGLLAGSALSALAPTQAQAETRLLRDPALSDNALAFAYAGDIWIAEADGSNPRRLTSHPGNERDPIFSPDGSMIAFTANYDGNDDVFVIDTAGGTPRRLTWHPGNDLAVDWTPDGKSVAFTSPRERDNGRSGHLYHVSIDGGFPQKVSQARIASGSYDESGRIFAAVPGWMAYNGLAGGSSGWRGYRGGSAPSIQLLDFAGKSATTIPGDRTTEFDPHWMGGQLYFLSDREDAVFNVFRFDPADGSLVKVSDETVWDIRRFDAHGGAIVYEAGGQLKRLDPATRSVTPLAITLNADLPQRQPQWKDLAGQVESVRLSPSGKRVAVTARGEVFTVPTDKGAVRNISQSAAVRDYTGIWSDNGTKLAYITDDGTGQTLVIEDQSGIEKVRRIALGSDFHELVEWGDGGKHLIYSSNKLKLFAMNVASGTSWQIAQSERRNGDFEAVLSPKGRWLAYTTRGETYNAALHLYDLETRKSWPVTGNFADITSPVFSKDGKLLFFAASTNAGPQQEVLDMTSQQQPYRAGIYAAVLEADGKSPLAPVLADEEPEKDDKDDADKDDKGKNGKNGKNGKDEAADVPVKVDPAELMNRTVSLGVTEASYGSLATDKDGALYYIDRVQPGVVAGPEVGQERARLMRYDFEEREAKPLLDGVIAVSSDRKGELLLLQKHDETIVTAKPGDKLEPEDISLAGLKMQIDPMAEWRQIFGDVWRMEKAYFYAENMHGLDWDAVRARYEPLLEHVGRREDLNELLVEMIAEMQVGHNRVGGGEVYDNKVAAPGLLGADFRLEGGHYRIERIFDGEQWNPFLSAPLAAPGVDVKQGDYILAINGRELGAADNIYAALAGTAGTQVTLTVASSPTGTKRNSVVEPIANEGELRQWAWIEGNRRRVEQASGGRVAYVYMPNTADEGYALFNRMYFAQTDKQALIVDERSNGGGQAANYVIDVLSRKWLAGWKDREGLPWATPGGGIHGPKAMLIDQDAGSGGDWMPYAFRQSGLGPLIGTRTWGGLIGISANPNLIDGGFLTVPFFRFYDAGGRYSVENEGVAPDIRVELDPVALESGQDTQLEAAIGVVLQALEQSASPVLPPPPDPTELGK